MKISTAIVSLPAISACGPEHSETAITGSAVTGFSMMNLGFTGGLISTLILISLVLSIALLTKKLNLWK